MAPCKHAVEKISVKCTKNIAAKDFCDSLKRFNYIQKLSKLTQFRKFCTRNVKWFHLHLFNELTTP